MQKVKAPSEDNCEQFKRPVLEHVTTCDGFADLYVCRNWRLLMNSKRVPNKSSLRSA